MSRDQPGRPDDQADPSVEAELGGSAGDGRAVRAQRRREQRRGEILTAAKLVFQQKGYHQASIHDVIDQAGIARGTFYLYFESKRDVFEELLDEFLTLIRAGVQRISLDPAAGSPLSQMQGNFRRVLAAVLQHEDLATIVLRDAGGLDDESREELDMFFSQVRGLIEHALTIGQELGVVRSCNAQVIAATALGGFREIMNLVLAWRRAEPSLVPGGFQKAVFGPDASSDALADELVAFFLRGVFT